MSPDGPRLENGYEGVTWALGYSSQFLFQRLYGTLDATRLRLGLRRVLKISQLLRGGGASHQIRGGSGNLVKEMTLPERERPSRSGWDHGANKPFSNNRSPTTFLKKLLGGQR